MIRTGELFPGTSACMESIERWGNGRQMNATVHVRAFARLRELFGDRLEVPVSGPATVHSVATQLAGVNPAAAGELLDEEGNLRRSVIVMVNRERITGIRREDHPVRPGDEVAFYPPVAGG